MEPYDLMLLVLRWLHILAATVAVGVPIYVRFALMPAMGQLDDETRTRLREAIAARWRILVYVAIVIFLSTGFYNYLGVARQKQFDDATMRRYHMLIGIKILLAFVLFFISSALAGRSKKLAHFRTNAKTWVTVAFLLGLTIVGLSGALRRLDKPASPTPIQTTALLHN